jgi:hypothetical protein
MTRKIPTRAEMHEHIVALCEKNGILIQWCVKPNQAWAIREGDEIKIPRIKSEISYAVGLHEIGHVLGQHQTSKRVLVREGWAWRWARKNALIWSDRMERHARSAVDWYLPRAKRIDALRKADSVSEGWLSSQNDMGVFNKLMVVQAGSIVEGALDQSYIAPKITQKKACRTFRRRQSRRSGTRKLSDSTTLFKR